jgi:DNA-directed RNA polymerase subunit beta
MSVQSEEGAVLEVREEDDDLLRAAEELGIDLTAGLRRQQNDASELAQVGVDSSALQDVIGAGNEPADGLDEPEAPEVLGAEGLLAAAAALSSPADEVGAVGAVIDLPDIEGLDDILEFDADDLESDDVQPEEE